MKKLLVLLLVLSLGVFSVACGADTATDDGDTEIEETTDEATDEVTDETTDETLATGVIADIAEQYGSLNEFSTVMVDTGDVFDESNFEDYDITMINIWATFCGPCISELPELEELYEDLPENVNLVGLCTDYSENTAEDVKSLMEEAGITYTNIAGSTTINDSLLKNIQYVPTTIFVDNEGNIIGEVQIGVPRGDAKESYMTMIEDRLEAIGK